MKSSKKIVVISNLIYPLRIPVFDRLSKEEGYSFTFLFLRKSLANRKWKVSTDKLTFNYKILEGIEIPMKGKDYFPFIINPTIFGTLKQLNPDVVISIGWAYPANLLAFLFSKINRKRFMIWNESTANEATWRRKISLPFVKFIVQHSDGFFTSGTKAKDYLKLLGVKEEKITILGNAIDNDLYRTRTAGLNKLSLRKQLGLSSKKFIITYVGRFEKVKGLHTLLDAYAGALKGNQNLALFLIGYGSIEQELKKRVRLMGLKDVSFMGPFERDEIIKYYRISDVVVLASTSETWGYVLNEALACSTPVVVSQSVGAAIDLVKDGINGYTFSPGDTARLTKILISLSKDRTKYKKLVASCYESVKNFNYDNMCQNLIKGLKPLLDE